MANNHKFRLSWLYNKRRNPKTCTTITITTVSISISKSAAPRIKARPDMIPPASAPSLTTDGDTRNFNTRKSYYFTRELTRETLAKHFLEGSLRQKLTRKTMGLNDTVEEKSRTRVSSCSLSQPTSTSNSISCSSPPHHRPRRPSLEFRFDRVLTPGPVDKMTSSSSSCNVPSLSNPDTVAGDVMVGVVNPLGLFPMSTYKKKEVVKDSVAEQRHDSRKGFHLSTSAKSPGMSIQEHSPRQLVSSRGMQDWKGVGMPRRNGETDGKYGEDVVVKSTFDPWRDFRDSMVEMIIENRIKESEDLEDLLMRYLSLNSVEHHDVIIAVFKQVWCNLTDIRLNEASL